MGEIRLLHYSDFHGKLGKYRSIQHFVNKRNKGNSKNIDACLDLGDMVDSHKIRQKTLTEILEGKELAEYKQDMHLMDAAIKKANTGQLSREELERLRKELDPIGKRIQLIEERNKEKVDQGIIAKHEKKYASIDEIVEEIDAPNFYVAGNHDSLSLSEDGKSYRPPLKHATPMLSNSNNPIYDICGLKVFARTNTNLIPPGLPEGRSPHLRGNGKSIEEVEKELAGITDSAEREAKLKEILAEDETYQLGKDLEFDVFVGHGQLGDTLTGRSPGQKGAWPYPMGACQLAREKGVPYLGGHSHHAMISSKDGFPGFIADWDYVYEHIFDSNTKKLKEVIVYKIVEVKPAAARRTANRTRTAA